MFRASSNGGLSLSDVAVMSASRFAYRSISVLKDDTLFGSGCERERKLRCVFPGEIGLDEGPTFLPTVTSVLTSAGGLDAVRFVMQSSESCLQARSGFDGDAEEMRHIPVMAPPIVFRSSRECAHHSWHICHSCRLVEQKRDGFSGRSMLQMAMATCISLRRCAYISLPVMIT